MTGTRTRSAAAANASNVSAPRKVGQKVQAKKRKHADLDQVTSDSDTEPRLPTSKVLQEAPKTSTGGSDGYSGPYPQHKRPTPEECQASQGHEQSVPGVGREAMRLFSSMHNMLTCFPLVLQVARDGLAALHGDPKRAALGEEKFELAEGQAAADKQAPNKESWQKTVLDSLVGQDSS